MSVRTTVRCQGRSPRSTSTRPSSCRPRRGRRRPGSGRRRSTSISRVRSPARAQVAARFRAVVLFPSPALALVTSSVTIGPCRSDDPEQAGAEVAVGVGLDRVGRAGRPEMARPGGSGAVRRIRGTTPKSGRVRPDRQVLGDLDRVVEVLQQADQADPQAEARARRRARCSATGWAGPATVGSAIGSEIVDRVLLRLRERCRSRRSSSCMLARSARPSASRSS